MDRDEDVVQLNSSCAFFLILILIPRNLHNYVSSISQVNFTSESNLQGKSWPVLWNLGAQLVSKDNGVRLLVVERIG